MHIVSTATGKGDAGGNYEAYNIFALSETEGCYNSDTYCGYLKIE